MNIKFHVIPRVKNKNGDDSHVILKVVNNMGMFPNFGPRGGNKLEI